jgi:replicative DNA helicase
MILQAELPPSLTLGSLVDALFADAEKRRAALLDKRPLGPVSGLKSLDEALGRAFAPGLHVVHGSPGVGKTAFALQIGSSCLFPCLFVTCEMTPIELLRRHTARVTGTFLGKLKTGEISGEEVRSLALRAAAAAPYLGLMDATEHPAPPAHIWEVAGALRDRDNAPDLLVIVDSLHSWADGMSSGGETEYDRLNEALAALRTLAKRLNCPVLAIAERNRGSMKSGGQSAGAGTRKIEYGAETVIELDLTKDDPTEKEVSLTISKNRNGSAGQTIPLMFNGALQRYQEWAV